MKLRIKVASRYNDANNQAVECKVGDTLVTGNAYGLSLIDAELAEAIFEEESVSETSEAEKLEGEEGAPETDAEAKAKRPARSSTRVNKSNPFTPQ